MVKNQPAIRDAQVRSLGWEDPLDKGIATHSGILAWRFSWTDEYSRLQSMGLHRVGHDWVTNTINTHTHTHTHTWVNYQFCHLSPLGKYCYLTKRWFPHLENRYNNITIVFFIKIKCTWYFRTVGSTQHMWNKWWQLLLCSALTYS